MEVIAQKFVNLNLGGVIVINNFMTESRKTFKQQVSIIF